MSIIAQLRCKQSNSEGFNEMLRSRETYKVRIAHSGGDRNQTSIVFNALKALSQKLFTWHGYKYTALDIVVQ